MFGVVDAEASFIGIDFDPPEENGGVGMDTLQEWEREVFGLVITETRDDIEKRASIENLTEDFTTYASDEKLSKESSQVKAVGKLVSIERRTTKSGNPFLTGKLAMLDDEMDITVWSNILENTEEIWKIDTYIVASGGIRLFNGTPSIDVNNAYVYEIPRESEPSFSTTEDSSEPAVTMLMNADTSRDVMQQVVLILGQNPGNRQAITQLSIDGKTVKLDFPMFTVSPTDKLRSELVSVLGEENVLMGI